MVVAVAPGRSRATSLRNRCIAILLDEYRAGTSLGPSSRCSAAAGRSSLVRPAPTSVRCGLRAVVARGSIRGSPAHTAAVAGGPRPAVAVQVAHAAPRPRSGPGPSRARSSWSAPGVASSATCGEVTIETTETSSGTDSPRLASSPRMPKIAFSFIASTAVRSGACARAAREGGPAAGGAVLGRESSPAPGRVRSSPPRRRHWVRRAGP